MSMNYYHIYRKYFCLFLGPTIYISNWVAVYFDCALLLLYIFSYNILNCKTTCIYVTYLCTVHCNIKLEYHLQTNILNNPGRHLSFLIDISMGCH
jgi:hypothetical protein